MLKNKNNSGVGRLTIITVVAVIIIIAAASAYALISQPVLITGSTSSAIISSQSTTSTQETTSSGGIQYTLRVGIITGTPYAGISVGVLDGFFQKYGVVVQVFPFVSGGANIEALTAGKIDIAQTAPAPLLYFLNKYPQTNIKIISAIEEGGSISWHSGGNFTSVVCGENSSLVNCGQSILPAGEMVTLPKYNITNIQDLKGKTIATGNAPGVMPDVLAREWMSYNGINPSTDVKTITMGFALMPGALAQGTIQAAFIWEPELTAAKVLYGAVPIPGFNDVNIMATIGTPKPTEIAGTGSVMITTGQTIQNDGNALTAFFNGYKAALDYIWSNPQNFINASYTHATSPWENLPPSVAKAFLAPTNAVTGVYDYGDMVREQNFMVQLGLIKPVAAWPDSYLDYSFVKAVWGSLPPYAYGGNSSSV